VQGEAGDRVVVGIAASDVLRPEVRRRRQRSQEREAKGGHDQRRNEPALDPAGHRVGDVFLARVLVDVAGVPFRLGE